MFCHLFIFKNIYISVRAKAEHVLSLISDEKALKRSRMEARKIRARIIFILFLYLHVNSGFIIIIVIIINFFIFYH
jgi:hypothetical protein